MTVGLITEKPSQARAFAKALGGMSGTYQGEDYVITHAAGHLYEFVQPQDQVTNANEEEKEQLRRWSLEYLPWDLSRFSWSLTPRADFDGSTSRTQELLRSLKGDLGSCDEIVAAGDVDPSGEGGLIFAEIVRELGLESKKLSRMYFLDESAGSITKAFIERTPIPALDQFDEFRKAHFRSAWDFGSMQFSRIATIMGRECGKDMVIPQGRLKSAMVRLVGDQLKAYNDYVKKPFFQNRFRDENGVVYIDPEEQRHDTEDQVPRTYRASAVVRDSVTDKRTAPPRLLDLSALSTALAGKGVKAKEVLDTYQKMYEAQVLSYPRTEDKTITPEQFNELLPHVDRIAGVVGVDPTLLTHRSPRKTHVKSQGAHGANRPGPKVPTSLQAVEQVFGTTGRLLYEIVGKNYLAMLAGDYLYEQHKGHVEDYPSFIGIANVPTDMGWRMVFDPSAGDEEEQDENESAAGLGTRAEPFIHEGANKRPPHPSMKWLMKQLEKRDVGTGATRTSTYSDVTNTWAKNQLLVEQGSKLLLGEAGELSWHLLPDTHIGDLELTERVYAQMCEVADGADASMFLDQIAQLVREDMATMERNAEAMRRKLGIEKQSVSRAPRAEGMWQAAPGGPRKVAFSKVWAGHEFTSAEIEKLLAGEEIEFPATSKMGKEFTARGALGVGEFEGRRFVGFQLRIADRPEQWCKRPFSEEEIRRLEAGETLELDGFTSKQGKQFSARISWDAKTKRIVPHFDKKSSSKSGSRSRSRSSSRSH